MSKLQSTDEPTQYGQHSFPEEIKKAENAFKTDAHD